jgi:hypothetical protein
MNTVQESECRPLKETKYDIEAQGYGRICTKGGKTCIRYPRVSLLLHCRWTDKHLSALSRTNREAATAGCGTSNAIPFQRLKILGELLSFFLLTDAMQGGMLFSVIIKTMEVRS